MAVRVSRPVTVQDTAAQETADLRSGVVRGLSWSMLNSVLGRFGQVAVGILLARLLTPTDFGVFAVALVAYTVVVSCSELGVSIALVRRPDEGARLGPTVTTLSLCSSALLVLALWAGAPALADRLKAPEAVGVIRALGLAVLVAGVAAVPGAVVQRDFKQNWRFAADTVNLVVSTAVAVLGALAGQGAYALAWSRVAGNAASAVILVIGAREFYRPGWDREVARELLRFGLPLAGASVLAFAVLNVDYVVVASLWGPTTLGFYVLAFNLASWPVGAFSAVARSVALPAFARLRDDPVALGRAFAQGARWLLVVSAIVSVGMTVLAEPLVAVVYGSRWLEAAVPLAFLAALGTMRVLHELAYDYLVAMARSRQVLLVQVAWLAAVLLALPLGARWGGLPGVGIGHLVAALLVVLPLYALALRRAHVDLVAVAKALTRPLLAAVAAAAAAYLAADLVGPALLRLLAGGSAAVLAYLIVLGPGLPGRWAVMSPWTWPGTVLRKVAG